MTILLASGLVGAVGTIAVLVGAVWWFGRRALNRSDDLGKVRLKLQRASDDIKSWRESHVRIETALIDTKKQLARERKARTDVQEQLSEAIDKLATSGDASDVSSGLRHAFGRLSEMSNLRSEAASDGDKEGAVHGAAPPDGDPSDLPS